MVTLDIGGGGSLGSLGRWGAGHVVRGAPASGGSGAGVGQGQRDLHGRGAWSGSKGDEAGSLSGGSIHFIGGREECEGRGSVECVDVVVLQLLRSGGRWGLLEELGMHLYLSSTLRGSAVELFEEVWSVKVVMVNP